MPEYLYPGVYIEETQTGNKPIEGVSTSTVGFLGVAERGPEAPMLVTSYSEFVRSFGHYYADTAGQRYLAYGVEGFFQNGGKRCFVQRAFRLAGVAAQNDDANLRITALGKGAWGNRIGIKIEPDAAGVAFRLTLMYWREPLPDGDIVDPTSRNPDDLRNPNRREPQITEVYEDLTVDPRVSTFYERQVNDVSTLVTVTQVGAGMPAAVAAPTLLQDGDDGGDLEAADFLGDPADEPGRKRGLDALNEVDEISLLCCPDEHAFGNTQLSQGLINQSELRKDRFAILSSVEKPGRPGTHVIDFNSKYAAYYYPWITVIDPTTGKKVPIPPSGHVAGIYARSDTERGVHKDPANEIVRGIDSLQLQITNDQQELLNPRGINVLRYFRGAGNLVWGGRTTSRDPEWRYINVRRLFIFVEKSIERATQWVVFETQRRALVGTGPPQHRRLPHPPVDGRHAAGPDARGGVLRAVRSHHDDPGRHRQRAADLRHRHRAGEARRVRHLPDRPVDGRFGRRGTVGGPDPCLLDSGRTRTASSTSSSRSTACSRAASPNAAA